jgi:ribosomal protein L40E
MDITETQHNSESVFCSKCGSESPVDAQYCGNCGFYLGKVVEKSPEKSLKKPSKTVDRPDDSKVFYPTEKKFPRCPRCKSNIQDLDLCPICGLRAPEPEYNPDSFFLEFMQSYPALLIKPVKFLDNQPYFVGWIALIRPVLWATFFAILSGALIFASQGSQFLEKTRLDMPLAVFLIISMAVGVLIIPWIILLYVVWIQLAAVIVGGRGRIERTCKAICVMLSGLFLLLGTLLVLYLYAKKTVLGDPMFLADSKWRVDYLRIPLFLKLLIFLSQVYFLSLQVRILARINYISILRSVIAHLIIVVPLLVYFALDYYGFV